MAELLPLFLTVAGRRVLLVGAGPVAASKLQSLQAAGADVRVVSPEVRPEIERSGVPIDRRGFVASDLDDVWLVVAAAPPAVNREVFLAAESRHIFVNAIDDPANGSAFLSGVVRRDGVTVAISTSGHAPGLAGLLREALDAVLPAELGEWMRVARDERHNWRRDGIPMEERRPLLLRALIRLYGGRCAAEPASVEARRPAEEMEAGDRFEASTIAGGLRLSQPSNGQIAEAPQSSSEEPCVLCGFCDPPSRHAAAGGPR